VIPKLLLTSCAVVCLAFDTTELNAQVPERVRVEMGLALAGESLRWIGGPIAVPFGEKLPADGLIVVDLNATVNVTGRVQVGVGSQAAVAVNPIELVGGRESQAGWGDSVAFVQVAALGERSWSPGVQVSAHVSAPTATLPQLRVDAWNRTGRATVSKSFHPRLWIWGSSTYSDFVGKDGFTISPLLSQGAGIGLGVTKASTLQLGVETFAGAERRRGNRLLTGRMRDGQITLTMTRFSRGRPRTSLILGVSGLQAETPTLVVGTRFTVVSF
jgi:hypothetical protein